MAEWEQIATIPAVDQYSLRYGLIGSDIYAVGSALQTQRFNIPSRSWNLEGSLNQIRANPGIASVEERLYVFGGSYTLSTNYPKSIDSIEMYDPDTQKWTIVGTMPRARSDLACATVGNMIYIFGGREYSGTSLAPRAVREIGMFNTVTQSYSTLNITLNTSRSMLHGVLAAQGKIYVIGGQDSSSDNSAEWSLTSAVEIFDPSAQTIKKGTNMPISGGAVLSYYRNEIMNILGSQMVIYSIDDDAWRFGGAGVSAYGAPVYGDIVYGMPSSLRLPSTTIYLLDLRTLTITNPSPASGFANEKVDNTFRWSFDPPTAIQASAEFQWRIAGSTTINSISLTSEQRVTIPADTFPNADIEWRISATDTNGVESGWTQWFQLTTIDQPHTRPTGLQPSGGWKNGTREIQFSWVVHSPLNSEQTAYEIEISRDNVEWQALSGKVQNTTPAFLLAPEVLERGTVFWRVRTYNTDDDVSPWSEVVAFVVKTAPNPPRWVGVTQGRSRPTVEWLGEDQVGWRLQVARGSETLYDSGERLGTDSTFQIPTFLPNGQYVFRVMTMNELSLWSDWAEFNVTISFRSRLTIELNGKEVEFGAQLTFDVGVRP